VVILLTAKLNLPVPMWSGHAEPAQ